MSSPASKDFLRESERVRERQREREREKEREGLLEGRGSGRPLRHILVQRMTMESKVVSPIVNLLLLHIKTGGKSHCL